MHTYQVQLNVVNREVEIVELKFSNPVHVKDLICVKGKEFFVFTVKHFANGHSLLDCDAADTELSKESS
jgi:hypothetical protein